MDFSTAQVRVDEAEETLRRPVYLLRSDAGQWRADSSPDPVYRKSGEAIKESALHNPQERATSGAASNGVPGEVGREATTLPLITRSIRFTPSPQRFRLLQQWEGTVLEVGVKEFVASLRDVTNPSSADERATFDLDDVAADERELIAPGAVFYWAIGNQTSRGGTISKVSTVYFRRLPQWTSKDLARIKERTQELKRFFGP
jgi:hypothetical protein